jgi:hypothetical protein
MKSVCGSVERLKYGAISVEMMDWSQKVLRSEQ